MAGYENILDLDFRVKYHGGYAEVRQLIFVPNSRVGREYHSAGFFILSCGKSAATWIFICCLTAGIKTAVRGTAAIGFGPLRSFSEPRAESITGYL